MREHLARLDLLIAEMLDDIEKRQYLNAVAISVEVSKILITLLSAELKEEFFK